MTEQAVANALDGMLRFNPATRTVSSVFGVMLALAGLHHGLLEITLHGNTPTPGVHIQAIGRGQLMWEAGTEDALTLIPNFLLTGVAASIVGLGLAWWSVFRVHTQRGPAGFLTLCVLLTLVGGGIGHVVFFVPVWAYSTRIRKPLAGWRRILPHAAVTPMGSAWRWVLALAVLTFMVALEMSVFGMVAGLGEEQQVLYATWAFLGASLLLINAAYACAAASDLATRA